MSELTVRDRGIFPRTHGDTVVHLDPSTAVPGTLHARKPSFLKRPRKFLLLFLGAMVAASVVTVMIMTGIIPATQPGAYLGILGIAFLVAARRWHDAYADWEPRRPRPRLISRTTARSP